MPSLCITTVVDSRYWDYVELFTWACKKSYPEYDVKILRKEEYFPGYPDRGYTTNALRMLTGIEPYRGYDYVYITDIDIMILREKTPLLDFHIQDMQGQCFSNSVRKRSNVFQCGIDSWNGRACLSGLHFCTPEWFERIEPFAESYRTFVRSNEVGRGFDGRMIFLMAKNCGFKIPGKKKLVKRHHGIHIGTFRLWDEGLYFINRPGTKPMTKKQAMLSIQKRVKPWKVMRWREYMADPKYAEIVGRIKNPDVLCQVKKLENYCKRES